MWKANMARLADSQEKSNHGIIFSETNPAKCNFKEYIERRVQFNGKRKDEQTKLIEDVLMKIINPEGSTTKLPLDKAYEEAQEVKKHQPTAYGTITEAPTQTLTPMCATCQGYIVIYGDRKKYHHKTGTFCNCDEGCCII